MPGQKDLLGKIALVTGAGTGIGAVCARILAEHGAFVIAAGYMDLEEAKNIVKTLSEGGLTADFTLVDLANQLSISGMAQQIIEKYKHIDILVNNAGIISRYPCEDLPLEQWERVININLRGTHLMTQAFIKNMREQGSGKIVNINCVAPGLIVTPMTEGRKKPQEVPIGRQGTPEDICKAVYFLSSPLSDYITGITLDVNGGMFMI